MTVSWTYVWKTSVVDSTSTTVDFREEFYGTWSIDTSGTNPTDCTDNYFSYPSNYNG